VDPLEIRTTIKSLVLQARDEFPDHEFIGQVDELDVVIEALIHPEGFEIFVRPKQV
jgi:hypothetical protein